ncbi:hypothetical protein [Hamadaea tsunoensis]|uniref:hypothetical protein n=1 Tax=Hamadaea tsunoensis TaxID=53368 RepID=UPI000408361F|nr:hypothetical protein [Hamadaea tsunoensis]
MNTDTILYLDERATRQACRHLDPAAVVVAAHRRGVPHSMATPVVSAVPGDPRLTVLVDRWLWLDVCLISSAYLAGLRVAATAAALAAHLLRGLPVTAAVLGATPETVEALLHALPGLVHLSVYGVMPGLPVLEAARRFGVRVSAVADAEEAVYGANLIVGTPPFATLSPDAVVLAAGGKLRLSDVLDESPDEGLRVVDPDDGGLGADALAVEIYRTAVRLNLGVRLPR